jgi:hypothetical protein
MSILKPGTLCVIIAGCPENIGLIVEVVSRIGNADGYDDGYYIATSSGRSFHQVWTGIKDENPAKTSLKIVSTERRKLRPLTPICEEENYVTSFSKPLATAIED